MYERQSRVEILAPIFDLNFLTLVYFEESVHGKKLGCINMKFSCNERTDAFKERTDVKGNEIPGTIFGSYEPYGISVSFKKRVYSFIKIKLHVNIIKSVCRFNIHGN